MNAVVAPVESEAQERRTGRRLTPRYNNSSYCTAARTNLKDLKPTSVLLPRPAHDIIDGLPPELAPRAAGQLLAVAGPARLAEDVAAALVERPPHVVRRVEGGGPELGSFARPARFALLARPFSCLSPAPDVRRKKHRDVPHVVPGLLDAAASCTDRTDRA